MRSRRAHGYSPQTVGHTSPPPRRETLAATIPHGPAKAWESVAATVVHAVVVRSVVAAVVVVVIVVSRESRVSPIRVTTRRRRLIIILLRLHHGGIVVLTHRSLSTISIGMKKRWTFLVTIIVFPHDCSV